MKNENIEGIGSLHGGEYDTIQVNGIGKLKGNTTARNVNVDGMFKSKGNIKADSMSIDGIARIFRDIKAKNININGVLKLRRANLYADKISCDGIIFCNKEVSADDIYVHGACSIQKIYGDKIKLINNSESWNNSKIPTKIMLLVNLYTGRKASLTHSLVDFLECTELEANGLKSKVIRANNVNLKNCVVGRLYCDGEINYDDSCEIGEIISKNKIIPTKKESIIMANKTLTKILDLYKTGSINADEAEKMLSTINNNYVNDSEINTPWSEDGKLRIVAFIGKKLFKKGEAGAHNFDVEYKGAALNVECYGNLASGNINGNASAGGSINCGDIGGNLSCGGSITCGSANGNISAGGGVRINKG